MRIMLLSDTGEVYADLKVDQNWLEGQGREGHHESAPVYDAIENAIPLEEE